MSKVGRSQISQDLPTLDIKSLRINIEIHAEGQKGPG